MHSFLVNVAGLFVFACVLVFISFTLYLWYLHKKYDHIPGPPRDNFYLGNLPYLTRKRTKDGYVYPEVVQEWSLNYGSLFVFWALHHPIVVANDPNVVKQVCVQLRARKPKGPYKVFAAPYGQRVFGRGLVSELDFSVWQKKRSALNPAFHKKYLSNLMDAFNSSCNLFLNRIDSFADGKTKVNMADEFGRVTLDVIGKVAFGIETGAITSPNNQFPTAILHCAKAISDNLRGDFLLNYMSFLHPFHPYVANVAKAATFLRDFGQKVIKDREEAIKRNEETPRDVLDHILNMAANDPSMTMDDIIDHFVTFFLAGQETTSTMMAFTLYEILHNPEILAKINGEIDSVMGLRQFVTVQDLSKLQYLGQTLKEGLRLHPPVCSLPKVLDKDETVGGYFIPATTTIDINIYTIHRHQGYWKSPETFDPDRFSPDNTDTSLTGVSLSSMFLPFALGPRNCIGQTLAKLEAKVIMARLLQDYKLKVVPGQKLTLTEAVTVRPKEGLLCTVSRR